VIALGSLVVVLAVGEIGIRQAVQANHFTQYRPDPEIYWYNRPLLRDHRDQTDEVPKSTNSRGFRGAQEFEAPRREGELRIMMVGDSSTFGLGVRDGNTYGDVLERELAERTGRPVSVINTASPGHTSHQGWVLWQRHAARYDPDILIWAYNNDSCLDMVPEAQRLARRPWLRDVERLLFRSDLYLMARQVLLDFARSRDVERFRQTYPAESEGWVQRIPLEDFGDYLERFDSAARERGAHAVFVRMPVNRASIERHPIYATSFDDAWRDLQSERFCGEPGRHCLNTEADFADRNDEALFLPEHLFHPSARGHAIIGKALAALILERRLDE
jgi:lysophospholipase L1-like esterase